MQYNVTKLLHCQMLEKLCLNVKMFETGINTSKV